ncbi:hypothetical protein FKG94_25025 [Exilibacterium tricleocarpae]|uniref:Uncharacterized protein n=1 Tax=Exilibacterium tricleocarpae TaxID=2591008 RepID=A0A545SS68_9GAMM|nr:hypothetical protein [Exilibacterium tricleocarpae]TQV67795.1 hypothetical protein FKG94_25025 [Exilibacterium tricleocarpae]
MSLNLESEQVAQLIVDLIMACADVRESKKKLEEDKSHLINQLHHITKKNFGENITEWVDWFKNFNASEEDRFYVTMALRIHNTRMKHEAAIEKRITRKKDDS